METLPLLRASLGHSVGMTLGLFYTQTESHAHEILRALENHLKVVLWEMKFSLAIDGSSSLVYSENGLCSKTTTYFITLQNNR